MIELEDESLRETIFFPIFGESVVFDDMASAIEYRRNALLRHENAHTLYTCSGERLDTSGILDPRGQRMPKDLKYMFGQMRSRNREELSSVEQGNDK